MDCGRFTELLDAFIDGGLSEKENKEFQNHAAACPDCARELEAAQTLKALSSELNEAKVPLAAQAAWREAVRREAKKKKYVIWRRYLSVAAAFVVLIGGTMLYARTKQAAPQPVEQELSGAAYLAMDSAETAAEEDTAFGAELGYDVVNLDDAVALLTELCGEYEAELNTDMMEDSLNCTVTLATADREAFIEALKDLGENNQSTDYGPGNTGTETLHIAITEKKG